MPVVSRAGPRSQAALRRRLSVTCLVLGACTRLGYDGRTAIDATSAAPRDTGDVQAVALDSNVSPRDQRLSDQSAEWRQERDAALDTRVDGAHPPSDLSIAPFDLRIDVDLPSAPAGCVALPYTGHAYLVCAVASSWPDALAACESSGMTLIRVDSAAEQAWLLTTLQSLHGSGPRWHLGGSDATQEGEWLWTDGTPFYSQGSALLYHNWGGDEPNDQGGTEDCLEMLTGPLNELTAGDWNDSGCSDRNNYICETR